MGLCICVPACVCGRGGPVFPGDLSGPGCLSIRAGAIRPSESGSIPSCYGDKIKAFRRPERSLACSLAHNVPPLKHPAAMEMQLWPFKSFLGPAVSLGQWHTRTQAHNASTCRPINSYTCTVLSEGLFLTHAHTIKHMQENHTRSTARMWFWLMWGHSHQDSEMITESLPAQRDWWQIAQ